MQLRPLTELMLSAVYDLAMAPPHNRMDTVYTTAEWTAYREGYYCALAMALRVIGRRADEAAAALRAVPASPVRKQSA